MHLRSVTLHDWKAYENARFDFPVPEGDRNVILIGGQNGFGKTTLFEAIVLGLFGRDGLPLVMRAAAAADEQGRAQSFKDFLERALHGRALRHGRTRCRVDLTFEDDAGEPIVLERTWHFTENGQLRPGDGGETLRILQGLTRRPVAPPPSETDPEVWYRDWISRTFLPVSLAGFFLFDGEAASVYAERDMSLQVRDGIEGLLGLTWLRQLAADLRDYAGTRRSQVPRGVTTEALRRLETEVADLERGIHEAEARLNAIAVDLAGAEAERDTVTRELTSYGTGSRAQLEDLIKERADQEKAYDAARTELFRIVEMDLPLALSGRALRDRVGDRLARERRREQWLAAAAEGRERVERVVQAIDNDLRALIPPLLPSQDEAVRAAVRGALEQLWHPPPEDAAENFRHAHARGPIREQVCVRLDQAASVTVATVAALLEAMARSAAALRKVKTAIQATEITAPQLEEKRRRITELNTLITALTEERTERRNFVTSRRAELEQKRKELARLTAQLDQSQRPARLAKRAEEVASMLDDLIAEAWPMQAQAVAAAMTDAIRAMAHRPDFLNRVELDEDGQVRLLAPHGRNLREFDLAAGEKQIFTQALFAAIARVSRRVFPLVIDTPLGRLDEEHRLNVLRHLAEREGQVILISTNTEVVDGYLDAIRHRVLKAYRIENRTDGDLGISWPVEGYFPGQGF
jgi:DNA sulfur modification protein DndD